MSNTLDISNYELGLKYQHCMPSGCKDVGIRKFEFVPKLNSFLIKYF